MARAATAVPRYDLEDWIDTGPSQGRVAISRAATHAGVRSRVRVKKRRWCLPLLVFLLACISLCGLCPVMLNMAALQYKAAAAALEHRAETLSRQAAELKAEEARLASASRLEQVATRMGLEPAKGVIYITMASGSDLRAGGHAEPALTASSGVQLALLGDETQRSKPGP